MALIRRNIFLFLPRHDLYINVSGNLLMRRLLTILVLINMTTSSYGQVNHMHDGEKETIYEKAIKELVRDFKDDGPIYIENETHISNFFWEREVSGRKVIFVSDINEKEELKKNGNLIRVYQIEYPLVTGDQLQIKINHMLIYDIDLQKGEREWPKKLTPRQKEITREGIQKSRLLDGGENANTYGSIIQNTWTYVIFRFDSQDKEFKFEKIETKTI
jgi:hypothetical protein